MKREEKRKIIDEVEEKLKLIDEQSVYFLDFKNIKGNSIADLRKNFKSTGIYYRVVKNDLLRIACKELGFKVGDNIFNGSVAIVSAQGDPTELAKKFVDLKDEEDKPFFEFKGGFVDGNISLRMNLFHCQNYHPSQLLLGSFCIF